MKKNKIILLLSLFALFTNSYAQIPIELKAGVNYVNNVVVSTTPDLNSESNYRFGYHLGIITSFNLNEKFLLSPELLLSNKGNSYERLDNSLQSEKVNIHLTYLNIPIMLGYKIGETITMEVGPELGYLLAAKSKSPSGSIDVKNIWDNSFDFGLTIGLKYVIFEKFTIGSRYIHGITSVIKDVVITDENGISLDREPKFQNRTFQFSLSYLIQ